MINIIIAGYPKSGNTWLTRLVAEIVNCPVAGFWNSNHDEIAIEGLARKSNFKCYKSHHEYSELKDLDVTQNKIIYLVRDPRDVVISGTKYFQLTEVLKERNTLIKIYNKIQFLLTKPFYPKWNYIDFLKKKQLIKAVLEGNEKVHFWCKISWKKHVLPYLNHSSVLCLRYEDLKSNPLEESKRINAFLNLNRTQDELVNAINNQSFGNIKEKFEKSKDTRRANFLSKGESNYWISSFSFCEKMLFSLKLRQTLNKFNYKINR
jgi:hypothetical protein